MTTNNPNATCERNRRKYKRITTGAGIQKPNPTETEIIKGGEPTVGIAEEKKKHMQELLYLIDIASTNPILSPWL
jgi:hypothetical protein